MRIGLNIVGHLSKHTHATSSEPLPTARLPHKNAVYSLGDNLHSYEPEFWEFQYQCYRYLEEHQTPLSGFATWTFFAT